MIIVKLVKLGEQTREYALESGSTVENLFEQAGDDFISGNVTRNHSVVRLETVLYDNDRIYIGTAVKGNQNIFDVNFVRLGDSTISLPAEDGYTIKKILEQLSEAEKGKFYRADGSPTYEFRIGGEGRPVDENHVINRPASGSVRIICSQRVKGN